MRANFFGTKKLVLSLLLLVGFVLFASGVLAQPSGANATALRTEQTNSTNSIGNLSAYAGNLTEVDVYGYATTQTWQGYFGNVSGTIQLTNAAGSVIYNWSSASPQGEIFASSNNSITWTSLMCFNYTANGTGSDTGQEGATSINGMNLTTLETLYGLSGSSVDGVNETFNLIGAGTHDAFNVGSLSFTEGECRSTRVYDSSGKGVNNNFEEVLMYEPITASVVFTSILDNNQAGFDSGSHDFEMLVLDNGHGGDISPTQYYFFMEIA